MACLLFLFIYRWLLLHSWLPLRLYTEDMTCPLFHHQLLLIKHRILLFMAPLRLSHMTWMSVQSMLILVLVSLLLTSAFLAPRLTNSTRCAWTSFGLSGPVISVTLLEVVFDSTTIAIMPAMELVVVIALTLNPVLHFHPYDLPWLPQAKGILLNFSREDLGFISLSPLGCGIDVTMESVTRQVWVISLFAGIDQS